MPVLITCLMLLVPSLLTEEATALRYGTNSLLANLDASFLGESASDGTGFSVTNAGDLNGDGYPDLAIGSYKDDTAGTDAGKVHVLFGKRTGWATNTQLGTSDDASFVGASAGAWAGHSVAGIGDINGDGYGDLLIGANRDKTSGSDAGAAYIIFGRATGWSKNADLKTAANVTFLGEDSVDWAGYSVGAAGDVNGDGIPDILIGANWRGTGNDQKGEAYLLFGNYSWSGSMNISTANASFVGTDFWGWMGFQVNGVGDVNADGYDDIMVSAYMPSLAYLFYGKPTGWALRTSPDAADTTFKRTGTNSGIFFSGNGDIDGDGYDDILIGDPSTKNGTVHIVYGQAQKFDKNYDFGKYNASLVGEVIYDAAGSPVSLVNDTNGDGLDDIMVLSGGNDYGGNNAGKAYIVLGTRTRFGANISIKTAAASFVGEAPTAPISVVGGVGDINGDGYSDLMIGNDWQIKTWLIFAEKALPPTDSGKLTFWKDAAFTVPMVRPHVNETVYVYFEGYNGDVSSTQFSYVNISSNISDPSGIRMKCKETGAMTQKFGCAFKVAERTDDRKGWIEAHPGENITVTCIGGTTGSLIVATAPHVWPKVGKQLVNEDSQFLLKVHYDGTPGPTWALGGNQTFLKWDATNTSVIGTPDNTDVGTFQVTLMATDSDGFNDSFQFLLTVNNTPPEILNINLTDATEQQPYIFDLYSSDDGQGTITWTMTTNAAWLTIIKGTSEITGTPPTWGKWNVTVTVNDGNGGEATKKFTLNALEVNHRPVISGTDRLTADENSQYFNTYGVSDNNTWDAGKLVWSLDTDCHWLNINTHNGTLNGTPRQKDIGTCWVRITVNDTKNASDSRFFSLTVNDVNEPPVITSVPITEISAPGLYSYQVLARDPDNQPIWFKLDVAPAGMTLNTHGLIQWQPTMAQTGLNKVIVNVTDGFFIVRQEFNVMVKYNHPPVLTSTPVTSASVGRTYLYEPKAVDEDGDNLTFALDQAPTGMTMETLNGTLRWVPTKGWVGNNRVVLRVSDAYASAVQDFLVNVSLPENHLPLITSVPQDVHVKNGERFEFQVCATDPDNGDVLSYKLENGPLGMTIDPTTGLIVWTPDTAGPYTVTVRVRDSRGGETSKTFTVTVDEKKKVAQSTNSWLLPALICVIVAAVAIVAAVIMVRRRRPPVMATEPDAPKLQGLPTLPKPGP
jgi:hypothetical protein